MILGFLFFFQNVTSRYYRLKGKSVKLHYSNVAVPNKFQYVVAVFFKQVLQVPDHVLLMYGVDVN